MESRTSIPTLHFDPTKNQWIVKQFQPNDTKINNLPRLTFLTYNIWFDQHNFAERGVELRKIMESSDADFICLQEVIQASYNELLQTPWAQKYYISGNTIPGYTTLILSKHPCRFFGTKFPTKMGRSLLYAELELDGIPTAVGTVHLESLGNPSYRKTQLEISYEQLKSYKMAFLMGDFNFDSSQENKNIIPEYVDIWKSLNPTDPGYTMPKTPQFPAWRLDRVIMKKGDLCKEISIERVGMDHLPKYAKFVKSKNLELKEGEPVKTPSDHYGLKCIVEIHSKGASQKVGEEVKTIEAQGVQKVKGNFVWIDSNIENAENSNYMNKLSEIVDSYKGSIKGFDDEAEAFEYIDQELKKLGDLTLIMNFISLSKVAAFWKMKINQIKKSFVEQGAFRVIVFTSESNKDNCEKICNEFALERCWTVTKFEDLVKITNTLLEKGVKADSSSCGVI